MSRALSTSLALFALFTLGACASSGATPGARDQSPDRISATEASSAGGTSAYDIVRRLRPRWLNANNPGSLSGVRSQVTLVYLDGHKLGGLEALRTISSSGIRSMQFLDATRAPTILTDIGSDAIAGAILIITTEH